MAVRRLVVVVVAALVGLAACSSGERSYTTDAEALQVRLQFVNQSGRLTLSVEDYREIADRACRTDPDVVSDYADIIEGFDLEQRATTGDARHQVWLTTRMACPELGHLEPPWTGFQVGSPGERVRSDDPPLGFPAFPAWETTVDALGYVAGDRWLLFGPAKVSAAEVVDDFEAEASVLGWEVDVFGPAEHIGGMFWSIDLAYDGFEGAIEVLEVAVDGRIESSVLVAIAPS